MIAGVLVGLVAHQADRVVVRLDRDVELIARYTIGTLTIIGVAAAGLPGPDRWRLVRAMLGAAVGVGAGVTIGRVLDRR